MKFLIEKDLDYDRQYQNLMKLLEIPNLMSGLPRIKSHNSSVRIIGADSFANLIPPCE